jgi:hypothetical protein
VTRVVDLVDPNGAGIFKERVLIKMIEIWIALLNKRTSGTECLEHVGVLGTGVSTLCAYAVRGFNFRTQASSVDFEVGGETFQEALKH